MFEQLIARGPRSAPSEPSTDLVDLHWYILVISPLCEKAVVSRLTRKLPGLVTYVPTVRRRRKIGPRRETIDHVLFPRYLFVGFEATPHWLFVLDTMGVQGVLGVDGKPGEVAAETVGGLMWRCASGQLDDADPPKIQRGMHVVAEAGVHRGFEGRVTNVHKATAQVDVLFEMFSKEAVTLRLDDVVSVAYA